MEDVTSRALEVAGSQNSETVVVGLIIEPTPGNRGAGQLPPDPTRNQKGGILIIPTSQDGPHSWYGPWKWNMVQEGNLPTLIRWP